MDRPVLRDADSPDPTAAARPVPVALAAWLQSLPGVAPGGPDLEYDPDFLLLQDAAAGTPESQFGATIVPAQPADWNRVRQLCDTLFARTRDLRVAVLWLRASLRSEGFAGLIDGLDLLDGLLAGQWEHLHPALDGEGDDGAFPRLNALLPLGRSGPVPREVQDCVLARPRGLGDVRVRDVGAALGQAGLVGSVAPEQLSALLQAACAEDVNLAGCGARAAAALGRLTDTIRSRFGPDAIDLAPLAQAVGWVDRALAAARRERPDVPAVPDPQESPMSQVATTRIPSAEPTGATGDGVPVIRSRADVARAIDAACAFLEATEPSNPAQLMLRRARGMLDKNFLELLQDIAPDAVAQARNVIGPDTAE